MALDTMQNWSRTDAERRISDVLDAAKSVNVQRIIDVDGVFEVKFTQSKRTRAGDVLARGGPEID